MLLVDIIFSTEVGSVLTIVNGVEFIIIVYWLVTIVDDTNNGSISSCQK